MFKAILIASALSLSITQSASAEALDAVSLQELCADPDPESELSRMCFTYILGSYEGMIWGASLAISALSNEDTPTDEVNDITKAILGFCLEPAGSNGELIKKIIAGLTAHPNLEGWTARTAVQWALGVSYPCN